MTAVALRELSGETFGTGGTGFASVRAEKAPR